MLKSKVEVETFWFLCTSSAFVPFPKIVFLGMPLCILLVCGGMKKICLRICLILIPGLQVFVLQNKIHKSNFYDWSFSWESFSGNEYTKKPEYFKELAPLTLLQGHIDSFMTLHETWW